MITELFNEHQTFELIFRLILAAICGSLMGLERTLHFKSAGVRTHIVVCCASALIMEVSKYGFADLVSSSGVFLSGTTGADPARVAAQVITGISFLGAGMIFQRGIDIKGLTSAAGIWVMAAVGLAIGAGMYVIGIFATIFLVVFMFILHKHTIGADSYITYHLRLVTSDDTGFEEILEKQLTSWKADLIDMRCKKKDNSNTVYELTFYISQDITFKELKDFMNTHEQIIDISGSKGN